MKRTSRKGFTLIELIVTIVILGILAALAVPAFQAVIERARQNAVAQAANGIAREAHALAAFDDAAPISVFEFNETTGALEGGAIEGDIPSNMTVSQPTEVAANEILVSDGTYEVVADLGDTAGVYNPVSSGDVVAAGSTTGGGGEED